MAGLFLFFSEQPGVLHGDAGRIGEHAHQLDLAFVIHPLVRAEHGHHADGPVVEHDRNAAETADFLKRGNAQAVRLVAEPLADQQRFAGAEDVFGQPVSQG